jgi:hypothetical protein
MRAFAGIFLLFLTTTWIATAAGLRRPDMNDRDLEIRFGVTVIAGAWNGAMLFVPLAAIGLMAAITA